MPTKQVIKSDDELLLPHSVEFKELKDTDTSTTAHDNNNCIRVYGGYACAVLQLRGVSALTRRKGGTKRRMIATAMYLSKVEVRALIDQLQAIEVTLYS